MPLAKKMVLNICIFCKKRREREREIQHRDPVKMHNI